MKNEFTIKSEAGATPISFEQAAMILTPEEITAGEKRGQMKTVGMWQIPVSYKALAIAQDFSNPNKEITVFGERTLQKLQQSGYEMEGKVSVNGQTFRGFTSSVLFELPNKKLINCAVIFVCRK